MSDSESADKKASSDPASESRKEKKKGQEKGTDSAVKPRAGSQSGAAKAGGATSKEAKAYKTVVRGGLKLKSGAGGIAKTIAKKRKLKPHEEEKLFQEFLADREKKDQEKAAAAAEDTRTASEKQFQEAALEREKTVIKKKIAKSHRQRIAEFNTYLDKLSEHYDIPRVGPG